MLKLLLRLRFLAGVALFAASFWGYRLVKVEVSEHERVRVRLAEQLARQVEDDLPALDGSPRIVVASLANDEAETLTDALRTRLHRGGHIVVEPGWFERGRQWVAGAEPVESQEQARAVAAELESQYVLFGSITRLVTDENMPALEAQLSLLDAEGGNVMYERSYRVPAGNTSDRFLERLTSGINWGALCAWLLIALSLPLMTFGVVRRVLREQSNGSNAGMLAAYGLVVAFLGWLLMVHPTAGWMGWAILAAGTVGSLVYFGYLCSQLVRAE